MIPEIGTVDQLKEAVLTEILLNVYTCGHTIMWVPKCPMPAHMHFLDVHSDRPCPDCVESFLGNIYGDANDNGDGYN